jgi:hypothetical protein
MCVEMECTETGKRLSWGVYPDFPKAGPHGYDVSKENMFDYDNCTFSMAWSLVLANIIPTVIVS